MPVTIRRFAEHEWQVYRDLRLRALADSPDSFGSTYDREAAWADSVWQDRLRAGAAAAGQMPVVALIDDTPVGLAWGRRDDHERTVADLFQVWVAPRARGQGVGAQLMDAVIAWARGLGVRALRLAVTPSHPAALRLYRRAGFVSAGEPEPLRPGSPVWSQPMQLLLDARWPNANQNLDY